MQQPYSIVKNFLPLIIMLISLSLSAQQPTKQEMEEMQKMMQQMKSDPEMQKAMKQFGMDSNSIEKMMSNSQSSNVGSASYYEFDEFQVPKKAVDRIASIPKKPLTNAVLPAYLQKTQEMVKGALNDDELKMTNYLESNSKSFPADSIALIGSGLWLAGYYKPGLYFTGKACTKDSDPANLNNYAAFLVMLGGEEIALPILQKINREDPKNATILNNIGQAWFGLGDLEQAGKYLDSTIMIFATHSQANLTKCVIEESKGNKTGAVEALRNSIQDGYSPTKEAMMRKLGYQVSGKELAKDFHMPQDPLGFDKWIARIPPFPKNYKEQIEYGPRWNDFYTDVENEMVKLQQKTGKLTEEGQKFEMKRAKKFAADPMNVSLKPPYLSNKMSKVLKYYINDKDGHFANEAKQVANQITTLTTDLQKYRDNYHRKVTDIRKKGDENVGEGLGGGEDICPQLREAFNNYVNVTNSEREAAFFAKINHQKKILEASAYCNQFITDNQAMIDLIENNSKIAFLQNFPRSYYDQSVLQPNLDFSDVKGCLETEKKDSVYGRKLVEWDSIHCDQNIEFTVPLTGTMKFSCAYRKMDLNPLFIPFEYHKKENSYTGELMTQSGYLSFKKEIDGVKVGVKVGAGKDYTTDKGYVEVNAGTTVGKGTIADVIPVKAGVNGSVKVEVDKDGISDVVIKVTGDAKTDIKYGGEKGVDIPTGKVEAGAKWSWDAGASGTGKAELQKSITQTGAAIQRLIH